MGETGEEVSSSWRAFSGVNFKVSKCIRKANLAVVVLRHSDHINIL
jgi:hypothetical protein